MSSLRGWTVASLIGIVLLAHDGRAEDVSFSFSYKDWELVCDNTRTCRAAGYQLEEEDSSNLPVSMLLTRKAGPNTPVSMELQLVADGEGTPPTEVRLQVGGLLFSSIAIGVGEELPQETAAKLLAVMPDEKEMLLTAGGQQQWRLSLAGLKAVLLKMDEKQGRIGTPGALAAKGSRPEQQVLPPIPMKTLIVPVIPPPIKEDEKVLAALKEFLDAECEEKDAYPEDACTTERGINRLSKDKLLVSLLIDIAAYNQTVAVWIVNEKPPYNPTPAIDGGLVFNSSEESVIEVLQGNGMLQSFAKGRGMADCSSWASWAWNGKSFEKAEESSSGMCRGFIGGTWDLPTFVSEVADEYKAPSGEWKLLVKEDKIHTSRGTTYVLIAVSPKGEQIHIDDNVRNAEVKWLNGETIEIIDHCGTNCRYGYFYNINKGLSPVFLNVITYSITDNLIAYPTFNDNKNRYEITISEIYTDKK